LENEGGVISSLVQQAIPAFAGGDHAMTSNSTTSCLPQSEIETAEHLFDNWFDPIEAGLRDRVREFLGLMFEGELDEVLSRPRYARGGKAANADGQAVADQTGHRHGHRPRSLLGSFGQVTIAVPRARLNTPDGKTTEWKSQALRAYQRRTVALAARLSEKNRVQPVAGRFCVPAPSPVFVIEHAHRL
jgi:putative transposase